MSPPSSCHDNGKMKLISVGCQDEFLPDGTALKNIKDYASLDVLCGRGGGTNHHTGNNNWRALVSSNKRLYISLPKKQKVLVAKSIVHAIRSQNPPGRFLQKDSENNTWDDIGDLKATEKTSQALREGAPDIRTEMEEERKKTVAGSYHQPGRLLPNGLISIDQGMLGPQAVDGIAGSQVPLGNNVSLGKVDVSQKISASSQNQHNNLAAAAMGQRSGASAAAGPMGLSMMAPHSMGLNNKNGQDMSMMMAFQQFQMGMGMGVPQRGGGSASANMASFPAGMMMGAGLSASSGNMAKMENPAAAAAAMSKKSTPSENATAAFQQFLSGKSPPSVPGGNDTRAPPSNPNPAANLRTQNNMSSAAAAGNASQLHAPMVGQGQPQSLMGSNGPRNSSYMPMPSNFRSMSGNSFLMQGNMLPNGLPSSSLNTSNMDRMEIEFILRQRAIASRQAAVVASEARLNDFRNFRHQNPHSLGAGGVLPPPNNERNDSLSSQMLADLARSVSGVPMPPTAVTRAKSISIDAVKDMIHKMYPPQPGLNRLNSMGSLSGGLPHPNPLSQLDRGESANFQQPMEYFMRNAGMFDMTNLDGTESFGPTPLRPGVSKALTAMKKAGFSVPDNAPASLRVHSMNSDGKNNIFWVPPAAAAAVAHTGSSIDNHVTSNAGGLAMPQNVRNRSGASINDLVFAAELHPKQRLKPGKNNSDLLDDNEDGGGVPFVSNVPDAKKHGLMNNGDERNLPAVDMAAGNRINLLNTLMGTNSKFSAAPPSRQNNGATEAASIASNEWENMKKASTAAKKLKLGKNAQSLLDDDSEVEIVDAKPAAIKRKRNSSAAKTGDRVVTKKTSKKRARKKSESTPKNIAQPSCPAQNSPISRDASFSGKDFFSRKRKANCKSGVSKNDDSNSDILEGTNLLRGISLTRGVSLLRETRSLPVAETAFDRGHSLAMSEISLDRGQSTPGNAFLENCGEGQFDDASEDEKNETKAKPSIDRGLTVGTIGTFKDLSQTENHLGRMTTFGTIGNASEDDEDEAKESALMARGLTVGTIGTFKEFLSSPKSAPRQAPHTRDYLGRDTTFGTIGTIEKIPDD